MDGRPETIRRCMQAFEQAWESFSAPSPIATV
jgi:hypothetical protein